MKLIFNFSMLLTADCFIFLIKLRWPKKYTWNDLNLLTVNKANKGESPSCSLLYAGDSCCFM